MSNLANTNLREVLDGRRAFAQPTSSADSIEVECAQPNCRGRFRVKATALGKKINCPICGCGVVLQKASGGGEAIQPTLLPVNGTAAPAADPDAERRQKLLQQHEAARRAKAEAQRRQAVKERLQAEQAAQLAAEHERKAEETRRAEEARREELRRSKEARRQAAAALQQQKEEELAAKRKAETKRRHEEQQRRETALKAEAERQLKAEQAIARAEAERRRRAQEEMKAAEARREADEVARRQAEAEVRRKTKEEALRLAKEEQIRREADAAQAAEQRRQEAWDRRTALFETLASRSNAETPSEAPHSAAFQDRYAGQLAASRHAFLAWQHAGALERRKAFEELVSQELRRWRLERHAMAANTETDGLAVALPRTRFLRGLAAFLLAPLEVAFCSTQVVTALGLLNPYRLAGANAQLPLPQLSPLLQQAKEAAQRGEQSSVGVGLEWIVPTRQVFRKFQARQWRSPAGRLLAQLTWVHLGEFSQRILLQTQELTSELFMEYLTQEHSAANEDEAVLLRHAQAVCWLHIAISREAAFAAGRVNNALGYWDLAMECWAEVLVDDRWWEYLRQQNNNGPVDEAREDFPVLLGGWIGRFARAYGDSGDGVSCHRLVSVMRRSRLPDFVRNQGPLAVVRGSFY